MCATDFGCTNLLQLIWTLCRNPDEKSRICLTQWLEELLGTDAPFSTVNGRAVCNVTLVQLVWKQGKNQPQSCTLAGALSLMSLYYCPLSSHHWPDWRALAIRNNYLDCVNRVSEAGESQVSDGEWRVMALTYFSVSVQLEEDQLIQRSSVPLHRNLCTKPSRVLLSEETKHSIYLSLSHWECMSLCFCGVFTRLSRWPGVRPKAILQQVSPLLVHPVAVSWGTKRRRVWVISKMISIAA